MRSLKLTLGILAAILISGCDFWPRQLEPLAESISTQVAGDTHAWLIGGDVVIIEVAGSPLFGQPALEETATEMAEQAIAHTTNPLESIVVTFHEGEVSEDPDRAREFIFLVQEGRPVLMPQLDFDATGPLVPAEVQAAVELLGETVSGDQRDCVLGEAQRRAQAAGDPEQLDPTSLESMRTLPASTWNALDAGSRRLFLAQMITTQALFDCVSRGESG